MSYRFEREPLIIACLFFSGYWHPRESAPGAYLRFHATPEQQRNVDLSVEIAMITWTNTLNNDTKWFSFVFLQERVPSDCEVGIHAENESWDLWCFSPHKQYLSSGNLSWSGADKGDYSRRWLNSEKCWGKEGKHTRLSLRMDFWHLWQIFPCLSNSLRPYATANTGLASRCALGFFILLSFLCHTWQLLGPGQD